VFGLYPREQTSRELTAGAALALDRNGLRRPPSTGHKLLNVKPERSAKRRLRVVTND
jgi:hypothetical protein